jgi:hypothetical protein
LEVKMRNRSMLAFLMCASALSAFTVLPRAHAQESLTYFYYQPESGGKRIPHTGTPARFVILAGPTTVGGPLSPGTNVAVQTGMPSTYTNSSGSYGLAYVNITGGAGGGISVFPDANGNLPLTVSVPLPQSSNPQINVNAYYFPISSGPGHPCNPPCPTGSAASIGEFSDTSGMLLWDYFVNVYIPPSNTANTSLTNQGNVYGSVPTTGSAVLINAYQTTVSGGMFDKWVSGPGATAGSPNQYDLGAPMGSNAYALALYHSACPSGFYWNSTSTISQCSQINCAAGKVWDSATNQCVIPTGGCPKSCTFGCYLPTYNQTTGQPVWVCKPPPGQCTQAGATAGCAAGQYCSVPGAGGTECNCLKCSPVK